MSEQKKGDLTIRVLAMPADTNPSGDVFGGWLLSQMDIAGGVFCRKIAKGRVVTVAIASTTFKLPVFVGDTLCCYVHLIKKGRTQPFRDADESGKIHLYCDTYPHNLRGDSDGFWPGATF